MKVKYVKDLPPDLGKRMRSRKHWLHWLHPAQGPLPDFVGQLRRGDHDFIGAVWLQENAVIAIVETVHDDDAPAPKLGSPLLRTYRWTPEVVEHGAPHRLVCHDSVVQISERPDEEEARDWKRQVMINVLKESVLQSINTCIGGYSRGDQEPVLRRADKLPGPPGRFNRAGNRREARSSGRSRGAQVRK